MSKIYEVFGFPLGSKHPAALEHIEQARCPFMEADCDGGGNRYLSVLDLAKHKKLAGRFPGADSVQVGVCSLLVKDEPWIVCPRRLLALNSLNRDGLQRNIRRSLSNFGGLSSGKAYPVWAEVRMKVAASSENEGGKMFDYVFDYVITGRGRKRMSVVAGIVGESERRCEATGNDNGYTLAKRGGELWVEDFPADPVLIVEVMTSSTTGGNKAKRTQIGMAFEDAVLGNEHKGPGINYRQVWGRMVSQLFVKSQVGLAWGGRTIWVLQDSLARYITASTALNLDQYLSEHADEVNILSFGYGGKPSPDRRSGTIPLRDASFHAGPISKGPDDDGGFVDIVKLGAPPPKEQLWKSLYQKKACGTIKP